MFSLVRPLDPQSCDAVTVNKVLANFGRLMMLRDEHSELGGVTFPRTWYRGGVGGEAAVRGGRSWTFDIETARFFANEWLRRFGDPGRPVVLEMRIDRDDFVSHLNERSEREVIVVGGQGAAPTRCIRIE